MKCDKHPEVAKKKYCKECRYGDNYLMAFGEVINVGCKKVLRERHFDTPAGHEKYAVKATPEKHNKKNNCKYFEKKKWYQ